MKYSQWKIFLFIKKFRLSISFESFRWISFLFIFFGGENLWDKTIPNGNTSLDCNLWLKSLDTQLNKPTNQNSIKVSTFVRPTNK